MPVFEVIVIVLEDLQPLTTGSFTKTDLKKKINNPTNRMASAMVSMMVC